MKIVKTILYFIVLFIFSYTKAQSGGGMPDHIPLVNETWKKFELLTYKITDGGDGYRYYIPQFPTELKAMENKIVSLSGYMVPIKAGRDHAIFLLSVLPVMQCMFCGQNGIAPMVQVFMKKDKARMSDIPIKITGKVHLNDDPEKGSEIQIREAFAVNK